MKKQLFLISLIIVLFSCKKETVGINDIISEIDFGSQQLVANGSDNTSVKVFFNDAADPSKITLNCTLQNGTVLENGTDKIKLSPEVDSLGRIFAEFNIVSSLVADSIKVKFEVSNYEMMRALPTLRSEPANISLSASSFSVENEFDGEITVQGTLTNLLGQKVGQGTNVTISDVYQNGNPVNGFIRDEQLSSNGSSQINFIYSPGEIDSNIFITLKAEVLDQNLLPTGIVDSLSIYVK